MTTPADLIDQILRAEGEVRTGANADRTGMGLRFYGASVGAVRGAVRDGTRRYPGMSHDEVTALASELWSEPVCERRLAAIVLLQRNLAVLRGNDLTRTSSSSATPLSPSSWTPLLPTSSAPARTVGGNGCDARTTHHRSVVGGGRTEPASCRRVALSMVTAAITRPRYRSSTEAVAV